MAVNSTHPDYDEFKEDWESNRDAYAGQRKVKSKGTKYLPPTEAMVLDGMGVNQLGLKNYEAYLKRAVFPDFMRESVETHIGLLHSKDAIIELPDAMEPLRERFSGKGEGLHQLLRMINEQQLVTGRLGLLLDVRADAAEPMPYVSLYHAEDILNWDEDAFDHGEDTLMMVVLDESGPRRINDFEWRDEERYRVLVLGDITVANGEGDEEQIVQEGVYKVAVTDNSDVMDWVTPMLKGKTLDSIPFVFVNSKDLSARPDRPPLQGLSDLCYTIYRSEADYREALHKQGQDTLVLIGGTRGGRDPATADQPLRVGANSYIETDIGGDAKYIGVSSQGLPEMRMGLENDKQQGRTRSGQVLPTGKSSQESGEALKTRIAAQTATLNQVALTSAAALQTILRKAAEWMGINPDEVHVTPNLEFADFVIPGQEMLQLMTAKSMGLPLSLESLHAVAADRGLTKLDFETEMDRISEEAPLPSGTGADPENPENPGNNLNPAGKTVKKEESDDEDGE